MVVDKSGLALKDFLFGLVSAQWQQKSLFFLTRTKKHLNNLHNSNVIVSSNFINICMLLLESSRKEKVTVENDISFNEKGKRNLVK